MPYSKDIYPPSFRQAVEHLSKLPTIGRKTAVRLALKMLTWPEDEVRSLAASLADLPSNVTFCRECRFFCEEGEACPFCSDPGRDALLMCVVEKPQDVVNIETTGRYRGLYHVLGGLISPLDGLGPEKLAFEPLVRRCAPEREVRELILALSPSVEGETTVLYIARLLAGSAVKISRLASGLPAGGDIEYTDQLTLGRAFDGRLTV
ncbi:MAG: recombination mediator RecR [Gemmatimonadota bacterium]|nr:recombination mediator RecR [Gemmatimonadota bacterium]